MSTSGLDTESSAESPQSLYDSPYSSPSQQVPHLAYSLTGLSCADKNYINMGGPLLRIVEQPQDHFRFRYKSEMVGTHGCLLGKSNSSNRTKTHPTVELVNYSGRAVIRCRLSQLNTDDEHPHKLLEDEQDRDVCYEVPDQGSYKVAFAGMGIIHTAKKDVPTLLLNKYTALSQNRMSARELRTYCENEAKKINLNIVRLRFSAHDLMTNEEICPPVYSERIHNMKSAATNDLKICRISRTNGRPRGGDDVYIFVEKVNKKNIKIRFFELSPNGTEVWTAFGHFLESDVHHQYAIVFRTPQYHDPHIRADVKVYIELVRPQDGRTSEPKEFTYKPDQAFKLNKKRKANSSYSSLNSNNSISDIPAVIFNNITNNDVEMNDESMSTLQAIPVIPTGGISPGNELGDALLMNISATSPSERQLYDNPVMPQGNMPSLPDFSSTELKQIFEHNSSIPLEERREFCGNDWSAYLESYNDSLPDETNSMTFVRLSNKLLSDSGKGNAKKEIPKMIPPSAIKEEDVKPDISKLNTEYSAVYNAEDGQEVKQLVIEICALLKKTPLKKQLVKAKLERLFEKRLSNGDTFLHMSLCNNRTSLEYVVKVIHHMNMTHLLNIQNNHGQTILHLAIVNELPDLVSFLVAKECDPMLSDEQGDNAVHYAVKCRQDAAGFGCLEALLRAAQENHVPLDLDAYGNEKQTALHLAVIYNSVEKTSQLLQRNAGVGLRDASERTPLHIAADMDYVKVMRLLLKHTSDNEIDVVDGRGYTALQILCDGDMRENTLEMVELLLQKKADPRVNGSRSPWQLSKKKPLIREILQKYMPDVIMDEDDIKSEPEDDVKSEPEDESGDESESTLLELPLYVRELAPLLDAAGAWRALASRLGLDLLQDWYRGTASPSHTLLHSIKQCGPNITSKSLALILEEIGQPAAAQIVRNYIPR